MTTTFRFEVSEENMPNEGVMNPPKTFLIYPAGLRWEGADQSTAQSFPEERYSELKTFLQEYYEGDLERFWGKVESDAGKTLAAGTGSGTWQSSIENVLSKGEPASNLGSGGKRGSGTIDEEEDGRAIPGGRYGCA